MSEALIQLAEVPASVPTRCVAMHGERPCGQPALYDVELSCVHEHVGWALMCLRHEQHPVANCRHCKTSAQPHRCPMTRTNREVAPLSKRTDSQRLAVSGDNQGVNDSKEETNA